MFYVFLLICAAIGIGVYLLFILNLVPGAREERLGVLEPLPPETWEMERGPRVGRGKARGEDDGLVREVRHYFYETNGRLVRQVRFRSRDDERDRPHRARRSRQTPTREKLATRSARRGASGVARAQSVVES